MKSRTIAFITIGTLSFVQAGLVGQAAVINPALIASVSIAAQPQALNPPYLSEMPSVDRVMSAMQTADPRDTALRQIGAFYQLMEIIKTLSGPREFRGFTPDEGRIMQQYNVAQYNVAQAADKSFAGPPGGSIKFSETSPYRFGRWDRRFGVEGIQTFKLFLSPALKAEFDRIVGADNARREARAQSYKNDATAKNDAPAPQQTGGPVKPGSQAELRRCIESGRSQRVCFTEVLNNGMDQMTGISMRPEITPGLRMTGDYSGPGGFRLIFQPDKVTMVCRGVPAPRSYSVEVTDDQANVKIQNESKTVVFALRQDGKMAASGPIRVTGQVPAGTSTEQTAGMTTQKTTRQRELTPLEAQNYPGAKQNGQTYTTTEDATEFVYGPTGTRTVVNYVTKTADCTLGLMTPTGPTPLPPDIESPFGLITTIFSGASVLMNGGSKEAALGEMLNLDKAAAPGLRMSGRYAGESGFSITFHPESATVACGDAERALEYSIQRNANQVFLKIQDNTNPIALQLRPDGSLFAEGAVQVNGRVIVGTTEDPKTPFLFAPRIGRCTVGSLVSGGPITTNRPASTATPVASPSAIAAPTAASSNPAPANVSLSIVSGFATQPGVVNPLAGKTVLVMKDSLENILAAGWIPPGSSTRAVTAWAHACETRNPLCQQGIEQVRPYVVASAKLDGNGGATLPNARTGTYYLVLQIPYNGLHLVWNLRVDLKPGANSVTLDQRNTTAIDR